MIFRVTSYNITLTPYQLNLVISGLIKLKNSKGYKAREDVQDLINEFHEVLPKGEEE